MKFIVNMQVENSGSILLPAARSQLEKEVGEPWGDSKVCASTSILLVSSSFRNLPLVT